MHACSTYSAAAWPAVAGRQQQRPGAPLSATKKTLQDVTACTNADSGDRDLARRASLSSGQEKNSPSRQLQLRLHLCRCPGQPHVLERHALSDKFCDVEHGVRAPLFVCAFEARRRAGMALATRRHPCRPPPTRPARLRRRLLVSSDHSARIRGDARRVQAWIADLRHAPQWLPGEQLLRCPRPLHCRSGS
jgi:hypothetical protein